jgi:hypothetical protein
VTLPPTTKTVGDVITEMTALGQSIQAAKGPADGVACFNRLYLRVTQSVDAALGGQNFFALPTAMHRLDVIFAQLYFDAVAALDAEADVPRCWNALFRARDKEDTPSLEFVLAGMNAHIDHDLACALLSQWEEAGNRPSRTSPDYNDFTKVNAILKGQLDAEKELLLTGIIKHLDEVTGPLDDRIAMLGIEAVREHAWTTAEALWDVREHPEAGRLMLDALDVQAAALGDALLAPVV